MKFNEWRDAVRYALKREGVSIFSVRHGDLMHLHFTGVEPEAAAKKIIEMVEKEDQQ